MGTIVFNLGDWSGDGHNITEDISVEANLTADKIYEAYEIGCKTLGFKVDSIAEEYEDSSIDDKPLQTLIKHGFVSAEGENFDQDSLTPEDLLRMYFVAVKLGNPDFEYKILTDEQERYFGSGGRFGGLGYGLFYN